MVLTYTLASVIFVSLLSLIGVLALTIKERLLRRLLLFFVAFSAGALIGDTLIHLFPEIVESTGFNTFASLSVLSGMLAFFVLEKVLRWRHCHEIDCVEHPKHIGTLSLLSDGIHNLIDGLLIASSYLVSIPLGVSTSLAVILHEVPQELGDFGILLHSGFTRKRALLYNFLSALAAVLGALIALTISESIESFTAFIIPFTAGSFLYIALSDLIPELHHEESLKRSFIQILVVVAGVGVMYALLLVE